MIVTVTWSKSEGWWKGFSCLDGIFFWSSMFSCELNRSRNDHLELKLETLMHLLERASTQKCSHEHRSKFTFSGKEKQVLFNRSQIFE